MKKILLFFLTVFLFSSLVNAQNVTFSTINTLANPGDSITVPVNNSNLNFVESLVIRLQYDPNVLSWGRAKDWAGALSGASATAQNGIVTISWTGNNAAHIKRGILVNLKFLYTGKSGLLTFLPAQSAVVTLTGKPLSVSYINGGVSPFPSPASSSAASPFTLSLNAAGTGSGNVKVNDTLRALPFQAVYGRGVQVKLEAAADNGNSFTGWSGDLTGTVNPSFIIMDTNKTVSANFSINQYTLTLNKAGAGSGGIKVNDTLRTLPFSKAYNFDTQVKIEAVPDNGSAFLNWSGSLTGNTNPDIVTMGSDQSITANFGINTFTLTINMGGTGSGQVKVNGTAQALPYTGSFNSGEVVNIEAVAASGNSFTGWSGDVTGTANPTTVTMNSNKAVTANFTLSQYSLDITKGGNGSGQVKVNGVLKDIPYSGLFDANAQVTIEAVAGSGSTFTGWTGDISTTSNPTIVTMNSNKAVTANFSLVQNTLTISQGGNGSGQVKVNGTLQSLPYSGSYAPGASVTIEAVPSEGSTFTGWSGDLSGSDNPATITMNSNKVITANFGLAQFTLSITKGGNGSGQIKVNGTLRSLPYAATFTNGSQVTLESVPSAGSIFSGWSGDLTGSQNPATVTMNGNKIITATFTLIQYTLTLTKGGSGSGQVKVDDVLRSLPYTNVYNYGTQVKLEAVADNGNTFVNWSGSITGSTNPVTLVMDDDKAVTANFGINVFSLTLNSAGNGSGQAKVNGVLVSLPYSGTFNSGSSVTLEAVPNTGDTFDKWTGDLTGSTNPAVIIMDANKTVTANFSILQFSLTVNNGAEGSGSILINDTLRTLPYSGEFNSGALVKLQAAPDSESNFVNWSGDVSGSQNPATVSMNAGKSVTVNYTLKTYSLSVIQGGAGTGKVNVNGVLQNFPFQGSYKSGQKVTIEAVANQGNSFSNWSGDLNSTSNPSTVTMNRNKNVTANFGLIVYNLSVRKAGSGTGQVKVNGNMQPLPYTGAFNDGVSVTLEAVADAGNTFNDWTGDPNGKTNPVTVVINGNKTTTATFTLKIPDQPVLSQPVNNSRYMPVNVELRWNPISNAVSYNVQLSLDSTFSTVKIDNSNITDTKFTTGALSYKTKYFWRLRARNATGFGSFSEVRSFITRIEPITCPDNLQAGALSGGIGLVWRDNSSNENGFFIFRKLGDTTSTNAYISIGTVDKNVNSYEDKSVNAGDVFTYLVLAFNDDTISCFSNQATINVVTSVKENILPDKYEMYQNYPNPFNPVTNISFDIPKTSYVKLRIFDILGREVKILLNEEKSPGRYTLQFDGSSLSSGQYIYLLEAGEYRAVKKFILMK